MITKTQVFDDTYFPRRLRHREAEMDFVTNAFEPVVRGQQADDVLIHGPQGVGKTILARYALNHLTQRTAVQHARIACLGKSTAGIVRAVLEDLPGPDPHSTMPREDLCLELQERVDEPTIVVLDEADDLPFTDALGRLADVDGLSMVVVCHDDDGWLSHADDSIRHRFVGNTVELGTYGVDELADILEERRQVGLQPGVIDEDQLRTLADMTAGKARRAIFALRAAAELAHDRRHRQVRSEDIDDSLDRADQRLREEHLASLPFHHHVVYELVRRHGPLTSSELHETYERTAESLYRSTERTPIGERARRNKLSKLEAYDLIEVLGANRHREYRVCDRAVASDLEIAPSAR